MALTPSGQKVIIEDMADQVTHERRAHSVVIVAFPGMQSLDAAGPAEVFEGARSLLNKSSSPVRNYRVSFVSRTGGTVATESAIRFDTDEIDLHDSTEIDTLVIPGGLGVFPLREDAAFIDWLRSLIGRTKRLVTVCTGTYLAAAAGALAGHTVTTHWARSDFLAELHPDIAVDADPIFIHSSGAAAHGRLRTRQHCDLVAPCDRDVWSSAGVTAGIDLCLAIVEHDHTTEVAQTVARWLVMYLRRPGGQTQFASPTWIRQAPPGPIQQAQNLVISAPGADHRIAALAKKVAMSERHFVRKFTSEVGMAPAKFVAHVRVDAARHELERSTDTVAVIAKRCGFGTAETLRRSLHRHLGVSPEGYRQRFSHIATSSRPLSKESI